MTDIGARHEWTVGPYDYQAIGDAIEYRDRDHNGIPGEFDLFCVGVDVVHEILRLAASNAALAEERDKLRARVEGLEAWLREHGRHGHKCRQEMAESKEDGLPEICTCGLTALRQEAKA